VEDDHLTQSFRPLAEQAFAPARPLAPPCRGFIRLTTIVSSL